MKLLFCVLWFLERWEKEDFNLLSWLFFVPLRLWSYESYGLTIHMIHTGQQFVWVLKKFIQVTNPYNLYRSSIHMNHTDHQLLSPVLLDVPTKMLGDQNNYLFTGWYFSRVASNMWCNLDCYFLHLQLFHVGSGYYTYVFPKYTPVPPMPLNYPLYSFS